MPEKCANNPRDCPLIPRVEALEGKSGKRWDGIVDKAIWAVLAAVIAFLMGRVGL